MQLESTHLCCDRLVVVTAGVGAGVGTELRGRGHKGEASSMSVRCVPSVHLPRGVQGDVIIGYQIRCHGLEGLYIA